MFETENRFFGSGLKSSSARPIGISHQPSKAFSRPGSSGSKSRYGLRIGIALCPTQAPHADGPSHPRLVSTAEHRTAFREPLHFIVMSVTVVMDVHFPYTYGIQL
jgi:hypothetical protein